MKDEKYKLEFKDRLRKLRNSTGISLSKYSKILNIPQRTLESWEAGVSFPSVKNLYNIANILNINLHWLITGETNLPHSFSDNNVVKIPILGPICAGQNGFITNEGIQHYIEWPFGTKDNAAFGFTVTGDSMIPRYRDGDVVICSRTAKLHPDCDVALCIGEDCFVKIWRPLPGDRVELACYNVPLYQPMQVQRSEIADAAKVVGLLWGSQVEQALRPTPEKEIPSQSLHSYSYNNEESQHLFFNDKSKIYKP